MESTATTPITHHCLLYTISTFLSLILLLLLLLLLHSSTFSFDTFPISSTLHSRHSSRPSSREVDDQQHVIIDGYNTVSCDLYEGRWVYDPSAYPLYRWRECPFLSEQVSCGRNGRPDEGYEHWRWQPHGCDVPRFNGKHMLEMFRGKRVAIVGDSINRNMWESLSCLLYSTLSLSRSAIDVRRSDYKVFIVKECDCVVEFYWSPFIVNLETRGIKGVTKTVLQLDRLPLSAKRWREANVIVFNTGHWWAHRRGIRRWDTLEVGGKLVEEMEDFVAFERAMRTWARWVEKKVDPNKTTIFFRSISPEHKRESLHWCYNQTEPITNETYIQWFPKPMIQIVEATIAQMQKPVRFLNITHLSEFRRDAHTAIYTARQGKLLTPDQHRQPMKYSDCSHWCLPGLPDTWNVLLYASLLKHS